MEGDEGPIEVADLFFAGGMATRKVRSNASHSLTKNGAHKPEAQAKDAESFACASGLCVQLEIPDLCCFPLRIR